MSKTLVNGLLLAAAALLVAASFGGPSIMDAGIAAAIAATVLQWPVLTRVPRLFALAAAASAIAIALLQPAGIGALHLALAQGVSFSTLLCMLGLLRYPVRRSKTLAAAVAYIVAFPARRRYAAVNFGSHFLSLLFNVGIVSMIGELLAGDADKGSRTGDPLLLASMRGYVLMTIWSPMGLGFAIVTTAIAGLDPLPFLIVAFLSAMLILLVTCLAMQPPGDGDAAGTPEIPAPADPLPSAAPLRRVLLACAGLLLLTAALHEMLDIGFVVATVMVLPLFSLLWLALEPGGDSPGPAAHLQKMVSGITSLRTESTIFLCASVIGAAASLAIREQDFWQVMQSGHYPALPVLLFCLVAVPLAGAAFVPHTFLVVLLAQLFGASPIGYDHPMALALALTLGWAMGIAVSPISAMSLIAGSLSGVPSHVVGFVWNRRFTLTLFSCSCAILLAAYAAGL